MGRQIQLRYRPEDLSQLEVWFGDRQHGFAVPMVVERHVHPRLPSPPRPVPEPTGVDYLGQVLAEHQANETGSISFHNLTSEEDQTG